ncbi:hypothetical protein WA026_021363 [Henosepilachna vigintioctopunctata]|uniref:Solute carrier family 46 member 3 n=1 Tax=Henosepilachna vigintioctopunctata TaxID=420089 RepID=A0AAW1TS18_9CUCU
MEKLRKNEIYPQQKDKFDIELKNPSALSKKIGTIKYLVCSASVEPVLFLTMFASVMYQLVVQNLYLEKACRLEIRYNRSVCDAMTSRNIYGYTQQQETEVQKLVSQMVALRSVIQGSFPLIVVIFAGSWSDRHNRRKPLILIPIIGEILCCTLLILNSIFFYELPLISTTLGDSLPFALLGGWPCMYSGVFSYIGSKYKGEENTMRVGIITVTYTSAYLLGSSAGGFLYQQVGFVLFFIICLTLLIMAFIMGYFMLKDECEEIGSSQVEKMSMLRDLFSVKYIEGTFKAAFKSGPNRRRYKVISVLFVFLFVAGPYFGELYMNYMYTRLKFSWDAAQFGIFTCVQLIIQVFGSTISVVFFYRILHWEETFLGIISIMGSIISNFIFAFAKSGAYLYIGACCDLFLPTSGIAIRSFMSKIVPPNELAQANSIIAMVETTLPLIFGPLYTTVYKYTLSYCPGTYFFVSVILKFLSLNLFIWLYTEAMKDRKRAKRQEVNPVEETN